MRIGYKLLIYISLLLLTSCSSSFPQCFMWCIDNSSVQREYVAARDDCRDEAETSYPYLQHTAAYSQDAKEKSAQLLKVFSDCMHSRDWAVAAPKKEGDKPKEPKDTADAGGPWQPTPYGLRKADEPQAAPAQQPMQQQQPYAQQQGQQAQQQPGDQAVTQNYYTQNQMQQPEQQQAYGQQQGQAAMDSQYAPSAGGQRQQQAYGAQGAQQQGANYYYYLPPQQEQKEQQAQAQQQPAQVYHTQNYYTQAALGEQAQPVEKQSAYAAPAARKNAYAPAAGGNQARATSAYSRQESYYRPVQQQAAAPSQAYNTANTSNVYNTQAQQQPPQSQAAALGSLAPAAGGQGQEPCHVVQATNQSASYQRRQIAGNPKAAQPPIVTGRTPSGKPCNPYAYYPHGRAPQKSVTPQPVNAQQGSALTPAAPSTYYPKY